MRVIARRFSRGGLAAALLALVGSALYVAGTSAVQAAAAPFKGPPVNVRAPTIAGIPQQGRTLTEGRGTWVGAQKVAIRWLRCDSGGCSPISGQAGSKYKLTSLDVGRWIEVQETASNAAGSSAPATSGRTAAVRPLAPVNKTPPAIAGTARPGQALVESDGSWSNSPTSFARQWFRCDRPGACAAIVGASGSSYTVAGGDAGRMIAVQVTAYNAGGQGSATSAAVGPVGANSSTTVLLTVPLTGTVTNQATTLVATIASSSGSTPPAGTVTFLNAGAPIGGCANLPVTASNPSVNVTCHAGFSAATSPQQLTAVFYPGAGSGLTGSSSLGVGLSVGRDHSSTALVVPDRTVGIGTWAAYTATVTPKDLGAYQPSGSVQFLDNGKPIANCKRLTLRRTRAATSAQCRVRYRNVARHAITAKYLGDGGFLGSISSKVRVSAIRLSIIAAKTHWVFLYTPTYAKILSLVVHQAPAGMTIVLKCRGVGCPFTAWSTAVANSTRCTSTNRRRCSAQKPRTVDLSPRFRGHRLAPGTVVTVELVGSRWIGKAYVFSTRAARAPRVQILCMAPGAKRPGVGCSLH
jgi:hypothetical protein